MLCCLNYFQYLKENINFVVTFFIILLLHFQVCYLVNYFLTSGVKILFSIYIYINTLNHFLRLKMKCAFLRTNDGNSVLVNHHNFKDWSSCEIFAWDGSVNPQDSSSALFPLFLSFDSVEVATSWALGTEQFSHLGHRVSQSYYTATLTSWIIHANLMDEIRAVASSPLQVYDVKRKLSLLARVSVWKKIYKNHKDGMKVHKSVV